MSSTDLASHHPPSRPGRARWFAAGAAVAVALGAGATTWQATASTGGDESTFVPVTPTRILDTRVDLGLPGPFTSPQPRQLTVTGTIDTADGTKLVVPTHANGIALNVTAVQPTAAGFISVRPGDATGAPTTSSLNFEGGETTPNAVTVSLPTDGTDAGTIEITYDAYGQPGPVTDVLVDVVGYTTTAGLDAIVADLATKADADDVIAHGEITMRHGNVLMKNTFDGGPPISDYAFTGRYTTMPYDGALIMNVTGPDVVDEVQYRLVAVDYCVSAPLAPDAYLDEVVVVPVHVDGADDVASDTTDRTDPGCHTIDVDLPHDENLVVGFVAGGTGGEVSINDVRSTWQPVG